MLSHEHLDHRGGLESVLQAWPQAWVRSPLGWARHLPCHRGERWQWQGLTFQALWPLPGSAAKGNNHSCVVRIDDGRSSILLTGDIERQAEQAMISRYWQHLASTLIQVPHHGSNTSSSELLVRWWMARPRWFPLRATMRGGCPRTRSFSAIASGGIAGSPRRSRGR